MRMGRGRKVTYGLEGEADFTARSVVAGAAGLRFLVCGGGRQFEVCSALLGKHNVSNILAAAAAYDRAAMQDSDPVTGSFHFREQVRIDKNRRSLGLQLLQQEPQLPYADRIETGNRFVKKQQLRLPKYCLGNAGTLQEPFR